MKGNIKSFVSGCIVTAAVVGLVGSASATVGQKTVALDYNDIMISVNGQTIMPTDSNGNAVEPFAINGTTYLPVQAVGEALGLDVEWDGERKMVALSGVGQNGISIDNDEVMGILVLDQISDQIYTLAWQMFAQVSGGAYPQVTNVYWGRLMDRFGFYDQQNDFMPQTTYEYQYKFMDQFESVEEVYDCYVAYSNSPTNDNFNKFIDAFDKTENEYTEMQNMITDYFKDKFPVQ